MEAEITVSVGACHNDRITLHMWSSPDHRRGLTTMGYITVEQAAKLARHLDEAVRKAPRVAQAGDLGISEVRAAKHTPGPWSWNRDGKPVEMPA